MRHFSIHRFVLAAALAAAFVLAAAPADALKVVSWNMLAYPQDSLAFRQPRLRTILSALDPDILLVQEMDFVEGRDSLLNNVLNVIQPGQWSGSWVQVGQGTGSAANQGAGVFWKPAKVAISNIGATNTPTSGTWPRSEMLGLVKPVGYVKNGAWFRFYNVHFKAGTASPSTTDSTLRRLEANALRTILNNQNITTVGPNFIVCGDMNLYSGLEGAYVGLTQSQSNNQGRCVDPISMPGDWHTIYQYRQNFTQCPCNTGCWSAQSGGGLDDRFDLILTSTTLQDGVGLDVVPNSALAYGNDGNHYNSDVNGGGTNSVVPIAVANALHDASDHLPVVTTLQLPAKYALPSQLSFGSVLVGTSPSTNLSVTNVGPVPAATLTYTLAATAGFTAPAGSFNAAAGVAANVHAIGMDGSTPAALSGTITFASNDNDTTSKSILLDGRVLAHAVPSLDSLLAITSGSVDFGEQPSGGFTDQALRVFDAGWTSLQARLAVTGASINEPRFSIAGGFTPLTFGSPGQTLAIHFDDTGAVLDSIYTGTLTLTTADETLPGATALAPITVALRARPIRSGVGVGGHTAALRFYPPRPNPARAGADLGWELPREARVSLAVYDLGGRRVALLADGVMGEGRQSLRWNAQDDAGRAVPAGLYFVRFETPGLTRVSRLVLLP